MLTGGYYGQHRIDSLECGKTKAEVGDRKVLLELPPGGLAEVTLRVTRCAYVPSLKPQSEAARLWKRAEVER